MNYTSIVTTCAMAVTVLAYSGTVLAQGRSAIPAALSPAYCADPILRSSGYRDLISRFPSRQVTSDSWRAFFTQTSYRDASLRDPMPHRWSYPGKRTSLLRYALQPSAPCD